MTNSFNTSKKLVAPNGYEYPAMVSVVCPKCGHMSSFPLVANIGHALEYAGVCGANFDPGLWCDAMLILQVTAHLAPAS